MDQRLFIKNAIDRKLRQYTDLLSESSTLMFQIDGYDVYEETTSSGFAMVACPTNQLEAAVVYEFKELSAGTYEILGSFTRMDLIGNGLVYKLSEEVAKNKAEVIGSSTWITPMENEGGAKAARNMATAYQNVDGYNVELSWTTKEESPDNLRELPLTDDFWNEKSNWHRKIFHMKWIKD